MNRSILAALAVCCIAGLGGCQVSGQTLSAAAPLVDSLARAGCKGTIHIAGQATSAAAGVPSAHIENSFDGTCDPATVAHSTP